MFYRPNPVERCGGMTVYHPVEELQEPLTDQPCDPDADAVSSK